MEKMSAEDIKTKLKMIIARVSRIDTNEMEDQVLFREELGIDSLMAMEILAACEKYLGIKIDETAFTGVERVGDFLNLVLSIYREGFPHHTRL